MKLVTREGPATRDRVQTQVLGETGVGVALLLRDFCDRIDRGERRE